MKNDQLRKTTLLTRTRFNPRPCMRGDENSFSNSQRSMRFQSTPLHEGRLDVSVNAAWENPFQSTPLHEGRHPLAVYLLVFRVSIHAPTRGATPRRHTPRRRRTGFNPHPHTGGDAKMQSVLHWSCSFNPRPHTGGDRHARHHHHHRPVSIHAPTRGGDCCAHS